MATVKAKDIPHETLALQKRIEFLRELKEVLKDQGTLVGETVKLYSELIDGTLALNVEFVQRLTEMLMTAWYVLRRNRRRSVVGSASKCCDRSGA